MPWTCPKCSADHGGQPPPAPAKTCFKTTQCQNKGKGTVTQWAAPVVVAAVVLTEAQQAAAHGYSLRTSTLGDQFPNEHRTSWMYTNASGTLGISPDGSTHSGGRVGWKGFEKKSRGWSYCGSFQPDLTEWPHRRNDRVHTMPQG
jgi:hypothetical protein